MIKAICFDLDGVYFSEKGKIAFHKNLVSLTNNEKVVIEALYQSEEMHQFVKGEISEDNFWNYLRAKLMIDLTNQELRDLWIKEYEVDQDVRDYVLKAREAGYITCVCSNNNIARVEALQQKFNFLEDFDVKIFSYLVGETKPQKKIFEALINQSGVRAEEIIYSDDNPMRIKGAQELGINVFVFEGFDQFIDSLNALGVKIN